MSTATRLGDLDRKYQPSQTVANELDPDPVAASCSGLIEMMCATCTTINSQSGRPFVHHEAYLPPHQLACRFVVEKHNIDYIMSLAMLPKGLALVFSTLNRKQWAEIIHRVFGPPLEPRDESIKCAFLIDPPAITDADVHQWFKYILSGLRSSLKPTEKMRLLKIKQA
ncbi:MAG: hypothetical protein ACLQVL_13150 [Terriglobia bacterium]